MTPRAGAGAAIVGIGATEFSKDSGRSELRLAVEAVRAALDDAGLTPEDVDGMVTFTMDTNPEIMCRLDGPEDVLDVRIVPARGAVAELRDLEPLVDESGELVDRHLGALARAVDREEAQAGGDDGVEVAVVRAEQLARALGGGVGRGRTHGRVVLVEGDA